MAARRFPRGGVAAPHYLASTAGLVTLAQGGNAIDAAIAANLALGVVAPYLCGYGGARGARPRRRLPPTFRRSPRHPLPPPRATVTADTLPGGAHDPRPP